MQSKINSQTTQEQIQLVDTVHRVLKKIEQMYSKRIISQKRQNTILKWSKEYLKWDTGE